MYCGNCFRDNMLVRELRRQGHDVLMVPLYLPMTLDEADESAGMPVYFGGISVYLEQKLPLAGHMPEWLHKWLASPGLLRWASGRTAKTRAADVGDLMLSMLRGEDGRQKRELNDLIQFLQTQPHPEVVSLSNALLAGMARAVKTRLDTRVVCMLQGEDSFLDSLPATHRQRTWDFLTERCADIDQFIAPSRYFGEVMTRRLNLPPEKVQVVHNGIELEGYAPVSDLPHPPVIGYFARMCAEKGLPLLVDAFLLLKRTDAGRDARLHVGGGMGPSDESLVRELKLKLQGAGVLGDVTFFPNVTKEQKQQFFRRISVLSVPALYGEAFGLYLVEAFAAGVPVVQPPVASFPELVQASGGGILSRDSSPAALAAALGQALENPERLKALRQAARAAAERNFQSSVMAGKIATAFESTRRVPSSAPGLLSV